MEIDLADLEVFARLYLLDAIAQRFGAAARLIVRDVELFTHVGVERFSGNVNGTVEEFSNTRKPPRDRQWFVSDEHRVEDAVRPSPTIARSSRNLFRAHSGVDEYARITGNDQHCISSRAAAKNRKFHWCSLYPKRCPFGGIKFSRKGAKPSRKDAKEKSLLLCASAVRLLRLCVKLLWLDFETRTIDVEAV
jgi:hypothetical protein